MARFISEAANAAHRFGYRRIHDLLSVDFPGVNHKRVYRLYSPLDSPAIGQAVTDEVHAPHLVDA